MAYKGNEEVAAAELSPSTRRTKDIRTFIRPEGLEHLVHVRTDRDDRVIKLAVDRHIHRPQPANRI